MGIYGALTRSAATLGRCAVIAVLAATAMPASAGDEVDYSAPYVTVENGELVTKYPAKAHADTKEDGEAAAPRDDEANFLPSALGVLLFLGVAVLVLRRAFAGRDPRR